MNYEEAFWMVFSPQGGPPKCVHNIKCSAIREAERLARENPGQEFYVLQAIEGRCVEEPMKRATLSEIPF
jgi:hypothetical protein